MSTPKPPGGGGKGKPFLGDADLFSELDAWDATFDALHGGPEASQDATNATTPVMEWPAPAALPDVTQLVTPAAPDLRTFDDLEPVAYDDIDDQLTLDRAVEEHTPTPAGARVSFASTAEVDPGETDFSEIGAAEPPAALGDLLGRSSTAPPAEEVEYTRTRRAAPTLPPADFADDDDDAVYTSASRPNRAPAAPDFDDDPIAPPPKPPIRRGPAIIRRVSAAVDVPRRDEPTPPHGHAVSLLLDQHTKVADFDELQRSITSERSQRKTQPPPQPIDEDDYADIEIDAEAAAPEPVAMIESAPRRTAHVVRRAETPARPMPLVPTRSDSSPIIQMDVDDDVPAAVPRGGEDDFSDVAADSEDDFVAIARAASGSEDDFSDVAVAVGATDDLELPAAAPRPGTLGLDLDADAPPTPDLDDALDVLDEAATNLHEIGRALPTLADAPRSPPRIDGTVRGVPPMGDQPERARPSSTRPPALTDLYPRVKTPTSVPPLGPTWNARDAVPRAGTPTAGTPQPRAISQISIDVEAPALAEPKLDLDGVGRAWPEQIDPLPTAELDEAAAAALLVYEREVATLDDSETSAALRIEAGRLCEQLADLERARMHYDAALLVDPRATAALRGLRRIARASGDLAEATRHLDSEIAVAGALERRPLGHYRVDLLMASGEQDLARVAVGEIIDSAPSDVRALLAQLELAFLDGRADEFGIALEQLAHAVGESQLRAAVQSARGVLAAHHADTTGAARWFAAAAEADPTSLAARLGAVRQAVALEDGEAAARALLDVARVVEPVDATTAAAVALRAQHWSTGEVAAFAAQLATSAAPSDPLVARLAAETAGDDAQAGAAFAHWASVATGTVDRAYAASRAAELDPARSGELWGTALALDPGDDYAAAQLRTAHVALEDTQASIDVDLAIASDVERDRARLRAAYGLIALGQLDAAIAVLEQGRAARPGSLAIAEALGEALAAAGKWTERATLFAELAREPGEQLDPDVAQLRSALAWEEAVGASTATGDEPPSAQVLEATRAALDAWTAVLERDPHAPAAHAAAIVLASRLDEEDVLLQVLARAQAAEPSPWSAASLGLRRARQVAGDPGAAEAILRELQPSADPRRTVALLLAAARKRDLGDAAAALEDRASQLDERGASTEVAALRLRAAQLALDDGDAPRATRLLQQVETALPHLGVVPDLLAAARRRAGDRPSAATRRAEPPGASTADAFARVLRDADLAASQGDGAAALALYQRALEMRPQDPVAVLPLVRLATQLRETEPIASLALAQLRAAEEAGDGPAKANACELLAMIDADLRGDTGSAQIALESASQADPDRIDLLHRLARHYTTSDQLAELLRLRTAEVAVVPAEHVGDRAALQLDLAALAARDGRAELELADLYRGVLATDPKIRLALFHLEAIVRRAGASEELADLEERIATYFDGDAKTQAAFWTRAGETLAELGKIDDAVQRFGRAEGALPGHVPALEGWRQAALKGQLWIDVAEAASRQAASTLDDGQRAALHHLAGVALMDKALVGDQAAAAFKRALDADPNHRDAFLRLRILLEEDANHDDLATLLAQRLEVEDDATARIELHRALAELHRNFLSDRETAKHHYRMLLDAAPNDLRAHAAIADIAWEQGSWQEAADALMARARLERQPDVLKTLCFRLGLIYADRLVDVPMALKAFQRALTYAPDDDATLVRLADLATDVGEWKLALGACERLVKNESDPDRRAAHLHRVARIFKEGFGDMKRAERALNLALDGSPTNDEALQKLVQFYQGARDITSVRVHLNRVTGAMRARAQKDPLDGVAYRVISRAMQARAAAGVSGSRPIARAAAELADMLGTAGEPEQALLAELQQPDLSMLARPEADEVLFPRAVQPELRQIFTLLGDRIAKHVGVDLRPYGATRGDRLRARENPIASVAQSVATALGFPGEIDVYVSTRQPWVMIAEPTSPVSLIIGSSIASAGGDAIRFAAGAALKLAQASLAIPARLPLEDLGVLVIALLRLFQPEFPLHLVDADAVAAQGQKLKRLIPTGLLNELRPYALAIDAQHFSHKELSRDLRIASLRAGLVASGSLASGLRILAAHADGELPSFLADPVAQGLVAFALGEDHAAVAR